MGGVPGHYRNPYKPTAVFFRVSGDEVGKKAFLVQAEKQVQACPDPPTLEEFLEKTEKKAVAGDASDSKETSSAVSARTGNVSGGHETNTDVHDDNGAGSPSGDAGASALPAHDPELDSLEDDVGLPFGTVPYIPGLEGAAHSAIERCLRAALYRPGKRKKRTLH
jgi:hypothetical protein